MSQTFNDVQKFGAAAMIGAALVICNAVMSFCGSIGNDAGFNPWTTDISDETNRGKMGAIIAVMPVAAAIMGTMVFSIVIDGVKGSNFHGIGYFPFFLCIGGLASIVGIICFFIVKESPSLRPNKAEGGFWKQFVSVFDIRAFGKMKELLWVFIIMAVYFIAFSVFFPYLLPYLQYSLGLGLGMAGVVTGGWLGPAIGTPVVKYFGKAVVINGTKEMAPPVILFRIAADASLFTLIPLHFAAREGRRNGNWR